VLTYSSTDADGQGAAGRGRGSGHGAALGINTDRLIVLTFFVSSVLGGLAGTLVG
jgi:ABC-type uncharacterized transport system permease subunit